MNTFVYINCSPEKNNNNLANKYQQQILIHSTMYRLAFYPLSSNILPDSTRERERERERKREREREREKRRRNDNGSCDLKPGIR